MSTINQHFAQRKKTERRPAASKPESQPGPGKKAKAEAKGLGYKPTPQDEELLKQFDLNSKFGPCTGMSRQERWQRAESFGLEPPQSVIELLRRIPAEDHQQNDIWHGRV